MQHGERIDAGPDPLEHGRQLALPQSWGIQLPSLNFDEVSTAATVKRQNGSIFSSLETNRLLDDFGRKFEVFIQGIPKWLQEVQFGRESVILLRRLNRVRIPEFMQDLDMFHLSGLASFVVFCCRYTEDSDTIKAMLQSLLMGELGNMVKIDRTFHDQIPYTVKNHIAAFIASHLDVDRNSSISEHVEKQIAKLCEFGDTSIGTRNLFLRRTQESVSLMGELLGAAGVEEQLKSSQAGQAEGDRHEGWAKIHDTLYLTSAYIALAAQAHGARHSDPSDREALDQSDEEVVVHGGTLEIAKWVAKKLQFHCAPPDGTEHQEPLIELWNKSVQYSKTLRWAVKKRPSPDSFEVLMTLERPEVDTALISPAAAPLAQLLQTNEPRLRTVARDIASVVHGLYQLSEYSISPVSHLVEGEYMKAMYYVIMAVAIEAVRSTIGPAGDSSSLYALNLATLCTQRGGAGNLFDLFCTALHEGIEPSNLARTAATVWGGAKVGSSAYEQPNGRLLGVVTRQCAVIFDMIRDLTGHIGNFQPNRLLSIWRGAVPMLPRDPLTDHIYGGQDDRWPEPRQIGVDYMPQEVISGGRLKGRLLITFEPFDANPTQGVFCFWFGGNLLAEFAPHFLLTAILSVSMRLARERTSQAALDTSAGPPERVIQVSSSDLLQITRFKATDDVAVVVQESEDAAWASFALACAAGDPASAQHLPPLLHRGNPQEFEIKPLGEKLTAGRVIILVP
ncbi:hypothetical protein PG990_014215 [Apiospora arundinis]